MAHPNNEQGSHTKLVATKVPEGFVLYERAGVGDNQNVLLSRARMLEHRNDLVAKHGEDVGLAYQMEGRSGLQKAPSRYFCVLAPITEPVLVPSGHRYIDAVDVLYRTIWQKQEELNDHVRAVLERSPPENEVQRMIGFVQGVNSIRGWPVCLGLTSDIIEYQQRQRRAQR